MCARVTSTYMEFTFTFGPKPEFKFSFKYNLCFRLTLLYHGTHCRTSVLFYFCAIHLTPAEEGEFLLCYVKSFDHRKTLPVFLVFPRNDPENSFILPL